MADADRARRGRRSIDDRYYPIAELLEHLAKIFAHVTQEQATAAGWCLPVEDGLPKFLAQAAVEGLWGKGEIALWGRRSVAGRKTLVRPDEPNRRLGVLERIPAMTGPLRRGEDGEWVGGDGFSLICKGGAWSVGDVGGEWCWVDIHLTHRSCRTAAAEARDMRRRFGEHREPISDEALAAYVKAHPKLGRPRIYDALRAAGYTATKERVANAIQDRDASSKRLKGGRPRLG